MSRYYLRTIGHLSLHVGGPQGESVLSDAKGLAVLAYLATMPDCTAGRDHLARLVWPGKERSQGRAALRQALYYLRGKTDDDATLVRADGDRLAVDRRQLGVDLWEFEEALAREEWNRVRDLHDGAFLGGYSVEGGEEFRHWRDSYDDGIRAGTREAYRALVAEGLERGEPEQAIGDARRWVGMNPLDEAAQEALIRSLAAAGDRTGALRAYESYRSLLRRELDESPGSRVAAALDELRSMARGPSDRPEGSPEEELGTLGDAVVVAGMVGALLLVTMAGWRLMSSGGEGPTSGDAGPEGPRLLVTGSSEAGDGVVRDLRIVGDSVRVLTTGLEAETSPVPSPDGRRMAVVMRSPEGPDVGVWDPGTGETRRITAGSPDEKPLSWSPDGRWIVYQAGALEPDGEYRRRYRVRQVEGGADRPLHLYSSGSSGRADWSPLGTRVAVASDSAGSMDVWTVHPDGTGARNLTAARPGWNGDPSWSPEGDRIAFVSDRAGSRDVWIMWADGSEPRRVTRARGREAAPVWTGSTGIAYLREGPRETELRRVDLTTGQGRSVGAVVSRPRSLHSVRPAGESERWLASVELPSHLRRVSPGQWIRERAVVRDASGEIVPSRSLSLRWASSDSSVVDPAAGEAWLRVRGSGEATLMVDAGGWRADTLRISSRPLEARELRPVLAEDWSGGIDSTRWVKVGAPLPTTVRSPDRVPEALLSRGDENYPSGVVARAPLRTERGLTVELWGRVPITRSHYQSLRVGLLPEVPAGGRADWTAPSPRLELGVASEVPDSLEVGFVGRAHRYLPAPDSLDAWHHYAVQVDTAGRVSLLVDGRLQWRSPERVDLDRLDGTHLALYGRTRDTRILHGSVRLYEAARYRVR